MLFRIVFHSHLLSKEVLLKCPSVNITKKEVLENMKTLCFLTPFVVSLLTSANGFQDRLIAGRCAPTFGGRSSGSILSMKSGGGSDPYKIAAEQMKNMKPEGPYHESDDARNAAIFYDMPYLILLPVFSLKFCFLR